MKHNEIIIDKYLNQSEKIAEKVIVISDNTMYIHLDKLPGKLKQQVMLLNRFVSKIPHYTLDDFKIYLIPEDKFKLELKVSTIQDYIKEKIKRICGFSIDSQNVIYDLYRNKITIININENIDKEDFLRAILLPNLAVKPSDLSVGI